MIVTARREVTAQERKAIQRLLSSIDDVPVLLIGSVARRTRSRPAADIDLLALSDSPWIAEAALPSLHVITMSYDDLSKRVAEGDDFAQWALIYGKPLTCRRKWRALRVELLRHARWPNAAVKRSSSLSRLAIAVELLGMGDVDAAQEELRFAAGHAARAVLLASGVMPLSRPELPGQLEEIGRDRLAEVVHALNRDDGWHERALHDIAECLRHELDQVVARP